MFRLVDGTKTLKQIADEMTAERGEAAPVRPARAKVKPKRKKLPRTFDRREKSWMQPIRAIPPHTSERILELRRDLSLSRADAARLLRVARNTVWDWETGYRSAPFSAYLALSLLAERHSVRDVQRLAAVPLESPAPRLQMLDQPKGRRAQAAQLRERMEKFSGIYNAAWLLRDARHGVPLRRQELAWRFANALAKELLKTLDHEALLYAVADSITCSPLGLPWEG